MKANPINWPLISIGEQKNLAVRWTFYAQWLVSKWSVNTKDLPSKIRALDSTSLSALVACFAAAVSENFKHEGKEVPDSEYWAAVISDVSIEDPAIWTSVNKTLWEAIALSGGKTLPAVAKPGPLQETADQPATTQ